MFEFLRFALLERALRSRILRLPYTKHDECTLSRLASDKRRRRNFYSQKKNVGGYNFSSAGD